MVYVILAICAGFFIINGIFTYQNKAIPNEFLEIMKFQAYMIPLMYIANLLIAYGYKKGYEVFHNMTFVVSSSKFFDMCMLVLVSYLFLSEVPSVKMIIGLVLVVSGLIVAKL